MTIDRAIKREQAKAEEYRAMSSEGNAEIAEINIRCSKYHEQLAEWLEELKSLKSLDTSRFMIIGKTKEEFAEEIRNKAIDDFTEALKQDVMAKTFGLRICDVDRISEQLKEGSADNEVQSRG